jgi:fucose permease
MRLQAIAAVYLSGMLAGISLILFPSAGSLFTDPAFHDLSGAQFGVLFTPQIITAIASSFATATIAHRFGMKRVLQMGLLFTALAMGLLVASHSTIGTGLVFPVLLAATAAIGAGFGFTISSLNAYAFDLFPGREDSAVTAIHVMTGTGQVGAALLLSAFVGVGRWWGAPLVIAIAIGVMLLFQLRLPLTLRAEMMTTSEEAASSDNTSRLPGRVWLFALVTFTYGAIEGTFGNWTPIYLETSAGLTAANAALGLSIFWAAVTAGRVLFAVAAVRLNVRPLFTVTPFVVIVVLLLLPSLTGPLANYAALLVAGLAISYFFPYSISLASAEFPAYTAAVSGYLVAGLQLGNGISANAVGLASGSIPLATIFQVSAAYAVVMALTVIYLGRTRPQTAIAGSSDMHSELPCQPAPCPQVYTKQEAEA